MHHISGSIVLPYDTYAKSYGRRDKKALGHIKRAGIYMLLIALFMLIYINSLTKYTWGIWLYVLATLFFLYLAYKNIRDYNSVNLNDKENIIYKLSNVSSLIKSYTENKLDNQEIDKSVKILNDLKFTLETGSGNMYLLRRGFEIDNKISSFFNLLGLAIGRYYIPNLTKTKELYKISSHMDAYVKFIDHEHFEEGINFLTNELNIGVKIEEKGFIKFWNWFNNLKLKRNIVSLLITACISLAIILPLYFLKILNINSTPTAILIIIGIFGLNKLIDPFIPSILDTIEKNIKKMKK